MISTKVVSGKRKKTDTSAQCHLDDVESQEPRRTSEEILLINPYVYDVRYPWIRWNQPIGLLKISSLLKEYGRSCTLLDCLQPNVHGRVKRHKVGEVKRGKYTLNLWNYGMQKHQFQNALKQIRKRPQEVWITCMVCYWWKSAYEIFGMCRDIFPEANIVLGGSYPTLYSEHVKQNFGISKVCEGERIFDNIRNGFGADTIVKGWVPEASDKLPDFDLYHKTPKFAAINAVNSRKSASRNVLRIVSEIRYLLKAYGIQNFAFYDDDLLLNKGEHFERILSELIRRNINAQFWGLHGIKPHEITENIASKMRKAKFQMITFQCVFEKDGNLNYDCYRRAARMVFDQGYRERGSAISCQYYIGRPGENLEQVVEDILELHNVIGTVIPVPFLPIQGMDEFSLCSELMRNNDVRLENLNVNFFPFAEPNGYTVSDYFDIIRMTAMLNKRVRRRTFDYSGEDRVAKALRKSISSCKERLATTKVNQK